MIDLNTEQGRNKVAELFLKDMNQPAIQFALYRSFRKYATLRDQLVDEYAELTHLPKEFFNSVLAQQLRKELIG